MMKKIIVAIITALMLIACIPAVAAEDYNAVPYDTYTYWQNGNNREAVEIQTVYEPFDKITGSDLGIENFEMPTDIDCDKEGNLYILDSDNGRVVVVDSNLKLLHVINSPTKEEKQYNFKGAEGIYLKENGDIYIADTDNRRVLVLENSGDFLSEIVLPDSSVIPDDFNYAPIKVVTDSKDYIYVLSSGSYYGALVYSDKGEFLGFYGSNTVKTTVFGAIGKLWDRLTQTEAKRNASVQKLPFQFISMAIDNDDFIYSLTGLTEITDVGSGQIRRLNPAGKNIYKGNGGTSSDELNFADEGYFLDDAGRQKLTSFTKLCTDENGFIYALDATFGHVFIYDRMCNCMAVFGGGSGAGKQLGTFKRPESVAAFGDKLYILDSLGASVTVFDVTDYGVLYKKAQSMTLNGKYKESVDYWKELLKTDKNNQLAYRGLAQAALLSSDYTSALEYAKLGCDQTSYAVAFAQKRTDIISNNVWWMIIAVAIVIAVVIVLLNIKKRKGIVFKEGKIRFTLNSVVHPFKTFYGVKYAQKGSVLVATILLLLYYIARVLNDIYSGFSFNIFDPSNYNSIETLLGSIGIVVLWVIVNWGVCVLAQGKGKLKEIYIVTCYALIPEIVSLILNVVFSNILVPEEGAIITVISVVCHIITAIVLCIGIMTVHEYDFFRFLGTSILTVLGMFLVVFIIFMVFILFQELFGFVGSVFTELVYR